MKLDKQQEAQSAAGDSISTVGVPVTVKEYAPSEVFTEPLPAYKRTRATAVQIARIAAFTVIACTTILGLCIIASSWIEATASCSQLIHAEALLHQQQNDDIADRPSYQALAVDPLQSEESSESKQESIAAAPMSQQKEQNAAAQNSVPVQSQFDSQSTPIQIKLPLQLDLDDIASSLMEKNQRSRMNCVIEKKRAEEVMDHQPKTVRLPFGVNITTDPRYEHVTGERMAIYCESGHDQRNLPMENMHQQQQQQAPVIVPMPMNIPMMMQNPQMPMPQQQMPGPMNQIPLSMITRASQEENLMQQQKEETPVTIITREEHVIPIFQQGLPEMRPINTNSIEQRGLPEKILYHPAGPEARMMQEGRMMEGRMMEGRMMEGRMMAEGRMMSDGRMLHTLAIPENRPIPMAEGRSISHSGVPIPAVPSDIVRPPPPPAFHKIPIHVPTILQPVETQQPNENTLEEEVENDPRPHFVQPRSVRSVDAQLNSREKRVRRYACSCTC